MTVLRLGTRASTLATTQSRMVADALRARGLEVELVTVTTHGDVSGEPLSSMGGTGVFASAIRSELVAGRCDLAVHSFKDLPTSHPLGLTVAAVPVREDPRDALVARDGMGLADLPAGARVGTGSPRRAAQVLAARPDLCVVDIRGNVGTRLGRVPGLGHLARDGGREDLDAVVVALAGVVRLGHGKVVTEVLDPDVMLPAPAQGALAVECRAAEVRGTDLGRALADLDDQPTRLAATAERAVLARLEAGCAAPVGCLASLEAGDRLRLRGAVVALDGTRSVHEEAVVELPDEPQARSAAAHALGVGLAEDLLVAGAGEMADLSASGVRR